MKKFITSNLVVMILQQYCRSMYLTPEVNTAHLQLKILRKLIMTLQNGQEQSWLQNSPSSRIDAALCDLLAKLQGFSDPYLDVPWVQLTEEELEELVIKLIVRLTDELEGQMLAELIDEIRD